MQREKSASCIHLICQRRNCLCDNGLSQRNFLLSITLQNFDWNFISLHFSATYFPIYSLWTINVSYGICMVSLRLHFIWRRYLPKNNIKLTFHRTRVTSSRKRYLFWQSSSAGGSRTNVRSRGRSICARVRFHIIVISPTLSTLEHTADALSTLSDILPTFSVSLRNWRFVRSHYQRDRGNKLRKALKYWALQASCSS